MKFVLPLALLLAGSLTALAHEIPAEDAKSPPAGELKAVSSLVKQRFHQARFISGEVRDSRPGSPGSSYWLTRITLNEALGRMQTWPAAEFSELDVADANGGSMNHVSDFAEAAGPCCNEAVHRSHVMNDAHHMSIGRRLPWRSRRASR